MGLGPIRTYSLKEARELARKARQQLHEGIDPITSRQARRAVEVEDISKVTTFEEAAERRHEIIGGTFKNAHHRKTWLSSLKLHAKALLKLDVATIQIDDLEATLKSIWNSKPDTANRVRMRIEDVLLWAMATGHRSEGPNPARLKPLEIRLGKLMRDTNHHRAMPFADVPAFVKRLRQRDGIGARALEMLILTATRSGELRTAEWSEFDLESRVWTIPAPKTKTKKKDHRVPLSDRAVEILYDLPRFSGIVFPSPRKPEKPISDMAMTKTMRDMKIDFVPHGFRTSFRTWSAEETDVQNFICELALGHAVPSAVEAAYQRSEVLERRRELADGWSEYVEQGEPTPTPADA
jgi:integrase